MSVLMLNVIAVIVSKLGMPILAMQLFSLSVAAYADPSANRERVAHTFLSKEVNLFWVLNEELFDAQSERFLSHLTVDQLHYVMSFVYPIEPRLRLLAVGPDGKEKPIAYPSDLRDMVCIDNGAQALEFVRLFSSSESWYRFPMFRFVEVRPGDAIAGENSAVVEPGVMRTSDFRRLGLIEPQVIEHEKVFRILRSVCRVRARNVESVAILDETVTRNGDYSIRILWERGVKLNQDAVYFPTPL